jgi:trehalose/maltose hydrolase-like predicted phosphorylase
MNAHRVKAAAPQRALARRFEAVLFDWDGTAAPGRKADATRLRALLEEASRAGLELAVVSGTNVQDIDEQLGARPPGPGGLVLALNRGSEVFEVGADGPELLERRVASAAEDAALSRAAELTLERLCARGLRARIVGQRLNRRKVDLIPEPEWADPSKAQIGGLLAAVEQRLAGAGIGGLAEAVAIAHGAAEDAGLSEPRVTSDAKHIEIGLTDKSDSARWIMCWLWRRGIAPGQVLLVGDERGILGGPAGSDSYLLVEQAARASAASVGVEPSGVPPRVVTFEGGPGRFAEVLCDQIARRRDGEPPHTDPDPSWTLELVDGDPLLRRVHESLLSVADGRMGTRGSALTGQPGEDPSVLLAGVYAGERSASHLLSGPRWNLVTIDRAVAPSRRVLDLHAGTLSQELTGAGARVEAIALSSLARPATAVLRVRATGTAIVPQAVLPTPPGMSPECGAEDGCTWTRVSAPPASIVAASHDRIGGQTANGAASTWSLERIACYEGTTGGVADERRALARVRSGREAGFEALLCEHRRAWAERWHNADVRIEGDTDLQRAVRLAIFHLLANVREEGEAALGARGLTGQAYRGHVFWDSDVHVLPFLAASRPRAARAMLEYRIRRLPVALRAARAQGRAGARFPWESAASGEDVTPDSAPAGDGSTGAVLTGPLEEHIVADVAWAAACYIDWTGDRAFATGAGLELLVETARWWASRIDLDGDGRAHIRNVMGPDEYHEHVDDNAYTNVMARWNLRRAARDARGRIAEQERRRWEALADVLVDGYDPKSGLYEQFDGFFALEDLVIAEIAPQRPISADLLLGHERVRAAQVVKQADALMLHYLVPQETAMGSLAPNLGYYEPRTAHGSTLSPGVHAALLARAGRTGQALALLRLTAHIDLDDIGQMTAGGLHMAAMGSVWRTLAFGFAGLQASENALLVDPIAVPGLDAIALTVRFRGSRVRLRIAPERASISAEPALRVRIPHLGAIKVGPRALSVELPMSDALAGALATSASAPERGSA